jgi:hypothetical protein
LGGRGKSENVGACLPFDRLWASLDTGASGRELAERQAIETVEYSVLNRLQQAPKAEISPKHIAAARGLERIRPS